MLKKLLFLFILILSCSPLLAQERAIEIVEESKANRLFLYALNKNEQDLDVTITVEATNFRQSNRPPRAVRVPAASKTLLINLIVERGKKANYTYKLDVTDSLSRRALRPEFESIKIDPKKKVIVYIPENCTNCDTLVSNLEKSKYLFTSLRFSENPELKEQLAPAFLNATVKIDSVISRSLITYCFFKFKEICSIKDDLEKVEKMVFDIVL